MPVSIAEHSTFSELAKPTSLTINTCPHIWWLPPRLPKTHILITGSRTLWNDLLAHDLVDEIHLLVGNLILGQGVPVFVGKTAASLRLIDTRRWDDSDNVLLRYEVPHQSV